MSNLSSFLSNAATLFDVNRGDVGYTGSQGVQGIQGVQGTTHLRGNQGTRGLQALIGRIGTLGRLGGSTTIPQLVKTSSYTTTNSDNGYHISTNSDVELNHDTTGNVVNIYNNSTSSINITASSGKTLYKTGVGSTSVVVLNNYGLATALCVSGTEFVVNVEGVSELDTTPAGEEIYTTSGTYTWTCPDDVTSVSVVCIGAGGGGASSPSGASGAGGGGLGGVVAASRFVQHQPDNAAFLG